MHFKYFSMFSQYSFYFYILKTFKNFIFNYTVYKILKTDETIINIKFMIKDMCKLDKNK